MGRILFRDYADGDLAQHRLQDKGVKMISPHFYVRGDGTCCYYYSKVCRIGEGRGRQSSSVTSTLFKNKNLSCGAYGSLCMS